MCAALLLLGACSFWPPQVFPCPVFLFGAFGSTWFSQLFFLAAENFFPVDVTFDLEVRVYLVLLPLFALLSWVGLP